MSTRRGASRWVLGFGVWTAVAVFFSTQRWVAAGGGWEPLEDALRRSLPQWYVWAMLSPFVFRADSWAKGDGSPLRRRNSSRAGTRDGVREAHAFHHALPESSATARLQ